MRLENDRHRLEGGRGIELHCRNDIEAGDMRIHDARKMCRLIEQGIVALRLVETHENCLESHDRFPKKLKLVGKCHASGPNALA